MQAHQLQTARHILTLRMLSHHHRCIFVHIPKCAGTSIEAALLDDMGVDRDEGEPFLMRNNDDPALGPPRLNHLRAIEYTACGHVPKSVADAYFKFSVVRNPWSRAVSLYHYAGVRSEFTRFACEQLAGRGWQTWFWFVRPQVDFVLDEAGALAVDRVFSVETLERDWQTLREILNLSVDLPRLNVANPDAPLVRRGIGQMWAPPKRKPRRFRLFGREASRKPQWFDHWRDYYDDASRAAIGELYREDIERFGYRFEHDAPAPDKLAAFE